METEYSPVELTDVTLNTFFDYIAVHISQNGQNGNPLFATLFGKTNLFEEFCK